MYGFFIIQVFSKSNIFFSPKLSCFILFNLSLRNIYLRISLNTNLIILKVISNTFYCTFHQLSHLV